MKTFLFFITRPSNRQEYQKKEKTIFISIHNELLIKSFILIFLGENFISVAKIHDLAYIFAMYNEILWFFRQINLSVLIYDRFLVLNSYVSQRYM